MSNENKVYLDNNGLIVIEVIGDQNVQSVEAMGQAVAVLIESRRKQGKPALLLDNLLHMGKVDTEARKKVVELSKTLNYDKTAMLGKGGLMRFGTRLMLQAAGKADKIRYFDDANEATYWLQSEA